MLLVSKKGDRLKIKFEDLKKIYEKLESHSQKGDLEIKIDTTTRSVSLEYMSNVGTETILHMGESDLNRFVTVTEKKWLEN